MKSAQRKTNIPAAAEEQTRNIAGLWTWCSCDFPFLFIPGCLICLAGMQGGERSVGEVGGWGGLTGIRQEGKQASKPPAEASDLTRGEARLISSTAGSIWSNHSEHCGLCHSELGTRRGCASRAQRLGGDTLLKKDRKFLLFSGVTAKRCKNLPLLFEGSRPGSSLR